MMEPDHTPQEDPDAVNDEQAQVPTEQDEGANVPDPREAAKPGLPARRARTGEGQPSPASCASSRARRAS